MENYDLSGFWVFVGNKRTTFGTPHPKTGLYSTHGYFRHFDTKEERKEFLNSYYDINFTAYKCTVKTGRRFNLGCTVQAYLDDLYNVKYRS